MSLILPFGGRTYVPAASGLTSTADLFGASEVGVAFEAGIQVYNDDPETTLASAGNDVRRWLDQSGNSNDISQAASQGVVYQEDTGTPYVDYAASGTHDDTDGIQTPFGAGGITAWASFRSDTTGSEVHLIGQDSAPRLWRLCLTSGNKMQMLGWNEAAGTVIAESATSVSSATDYVAIGTFDTSSAIIYYNGTSDGSATNTAGTLESGSSKTFLASRNLTTNRFNGRIYAFGWINRVLSTSERSDLNTYLASLHP